MSGLDRKQLRKLILPLTTADFDFVLPQELIAQKPLSQRDESRLLHLHRPASQLSDHHFGDILQ